MSAPISGGKHPHFSDYRRMPVCTHSTPPFHFSTAGHWGCCPLLAVVSDAAVDVGEHTSARIHLQFFRVHDLKGNLRVKSASSFTPGGPSTPSSIVAALFWIATSPASSSVLATSFFPESSHPSGCDVVSHGGFACISLMTKDGEHPSTCTWAICVTSWVPVHFCTFIFLMVFRIGSHSHKHNLQLLPWLTFNVWISLAQGPVASPLLGFPGGFLAPPTSFLPPTLCMAPSVTHT